MNAQLTDSFKALEKAKDALETAKYNLAGGFRLATVNRTYYAMFYCMTALLFTQNVYAKTHHGLKIKFNELFMKTGLIQPVAISSYIQEAFDLRQQADYDLDAAISDEESRILVDKATLFYQQTELYLMQLQ